MLVYVAGLCAAILVLYVGLILAVGMRRGLLKLDPTTNTPHPAFDRLQRVQVNTGEQLVIFLPAYWLCVFTGSPQAALGLGLLWLVGRVIYGMGYVQSFDKRGAGFALTLLVSVLLLGFSIYGLIAHGIVVPA